MGINTLETPKYLLHVVLMFVPKCKAWLWFACCSIGSKTLSFNILFILVKDHILVSYLHLRTLKSHESLYTEVKPQGCKILGDKFYNRVTDPAKYYSFWWETVHLFYLVNIERQKLTIARILVKKNKKKNKYVWSV